MNRFLFLPLLLLFLSPGLLLADGCDPSGTQIEMNQCALEDFEKIDAKLNQVWKQLLDKEKDNTSYIKKLRAAQRAWIVFRDAEIAAMFACDEDNPRYCWGSMYPMLYHIALGELTEARIKRLQEYLDDGQNPAVDE